MTDRETLLAQAQGLLDADQPRQALIHFNSLLKRFPTFPPALLGAALSHLKLRQPQPALLHLKSLLQQDPNHLEGLLATGEALKSMQKYRAAAQAFSAVTRLAPHDWRGWAYLGDTLRLADQPKDALANLRKALELNPSYSELYNLTALALRDLGAWEEGEKLLRQAIAQAPTARLWNTLGQFLDHLDRVEEAIASFNQALKAEPNFPEACFSRALIYLKLGRYREGWADYETRFQLPGKAPRRPPEGVQWRGEPLIDKRLLLVAEQGLGDTLQFIRYAAILAERGAQITFWGPERLLPLIKSTPGVINVSSHSADPPPFDYYIHLMSLPHILSHSLDQIPRKVPYLRVESQRVEHWRRWLETVAPGRIRIGLAWFGNEKNRNYERFFHLSQARALLEVEGVKWISLQMGHGSQEIEELPPELRPVPLPPDADREAAFLDTAAVMQNLDLIITCDTSIAHLAGALARPVWILLPLAADWRWLRERDDSPWYPTARLFRQPKLQAWEELMVQVAQTLRTHLVRRQS